MIKSLHQNNGTGWQLCNAKGQCFLTTIPHKVTCQRCIRITKSILKNIK